MGLLTTMVRRSKLALGLVVLLLAAAIGLAYAGMAEPLVSPDQLPGSPVVGGGAIVALVVVAAVASSYLDTGAWKQMGRQAGLTPGGGQFASGLPEESGKPVLAGTVEGRPVRARTYSTGGGRHSSSTTYTVVEAELETPVDWSARFGGPGRESPEDPGVDAAKTQTVEGVGVAGDVPDDLARGILSAAVRDALSTVDGAVSVGDVKQNVVDDMIDTLPEGSGSMAETLARGVLNAGSEGDGGPTRKVEHRDSGLLTDAAELQRRIAAVAAVADAVDRTSDAAATE